MAKYKAGKQRFSMVYMQFVRDIFVQWKILWLFPVWVYHDTLLDAGQVDEVVYLLNHPEEVKERFKTYMNGRKKFSD